MAVEEVFVVGTSQSVAPVAVREKLHVDLEEVYRAPVELLVDRGILQEALPLSTCGRLELYGVTENPERALKLLVRLLAERSGLDREQVRSHIYALRGAAAVRHLFRVASGLESVVHGEAQILGQVRTAAYDPRAEGTKGPVLHRLFETALATGKKVRSQTEIGRGAASLASASIAMIQRDLGDLGDVSALVVGAGDTGRLIAHILSKLGVGRLVLANRTIDVAQAVAEPLGAEVIEFDEIPSELPGADLLVGAVTLDSYLLSKGDLDHVRRSGRPIYLLDLAHPRNFDPRLAESPDVELFDLEHVFARVEAARASRAAQIPKAERIVKSQARSFSDWQRSRRSIDTLKAVRAKVLAVASEEAERFAQGRSNEEREQMRLLARSLARTLLHQPTLALRSADPESPEGRFLLEQVPALFGVEHDDAASAFSEAAGLDGSG